MYVYIYICIRRGLRHSDAALLVFILAPALGSLVGPLLDLWHF